MNQEMNQFNETLKKNLRIFLYVFLIIAVVIIGIIVIIKMNHKKPVQSTPNPETPDHSNSEEVVYQCTKEKVSYNGPFHDKKMSYELVESYYFKWDTKQISYGSITYTFLFPSLEYYQVYDMSSSTKPINTSFDEKELKKVYTYGISIPAEKGLEDVDAYLEQLKKQKYTCTK